MNLNEIKEDLFLSKVKKSKIGSSTSKLADRDNSKAAYFKLRFEEMKIINDHLVMLNELHSKKIAEIVNTNKKFISIIAHDLRSPFNSVLYFLMLLKENLYQSDKNTIEEYIEDITVLTNGTLNLLDNLLEWAMMQNMGKTFNPVKINLHELLKQESACHHQFLKHKQITLNHFIAPDLNIVADLQMTITIFRNLINNAIKYTNTGGEIVVSASEYKRFVEIAVKDTGIGISDEVKKNLFKIDAFHSTSGTNNEKGTGLGLLLCKDFIEMHGGKIQVESIPGFGSEFKFSLPHYI